MSVHGYLIGALFWQGRLKASCACHRCQSLMLACYLDSGETRIIKIRIAKKNTENLKNRNVLYTQKFLALRYHHSLLTPASSDTCIHNCRDLIHHSATQVLFEQHGLHDDKIMASIVVININRDYK